MVRVHEVRQNVIPVQLGLLSVLGAVPHVLKEVERDEAGVLLGLVENVGLVDHVDLTIGDDVLQVIGQELTTWKTKIRNNGKSSSSNSVTLVGE